jgi:uroporphyrinogen decarboxylase
VYRLIGDFIDIAVDALNPVQVSARDMDPEKLKNEFGREITFWGGIDTHKVLPFETPVQVKEEVKRKIDDLGSVGGYVVSAVHNIQAEVPPENVMALFEAGKEYGTKNEYEVPLGTLVFRPGGTT